MLEIKDSSQSTQQQCFLKLDNTGQLVFDTHASPGVSKANDPKECPRDVTGSSPLREHITESKGSKSSHDNVTDASVTDKSQVNKSGDQTRLPEKVKTNYADVKFSAPKMRPVFQQSFDKSANEKNTDQKSKTQCT